MTVRWNRLSAGALAVAAVMSVVGCGNAPLPQTASQPAGAATSGPSVTGRSTSSRSASTRPASTRPASTSGGPRSAGSSTATAPSPTAPTPKSHPQNSASTPPSPTPTLPPRTTPSTTATPSAKPTPPAKTAPAALLSRGDAGTKVRDLQHRLGQLDWFSGPVTGRYGAATVNGVRGFQTKRGLDATGSVDESTWSSLVSRTRQPTDDEVHNRMRPGPAILEQAASGDQVRELQARLKQIDWYSGDITGFYGPATTAQVRGFQGRQAIPVTGDVDQRTWNRLAAMTRTPTGDEKENLKAKPPTPPAPTLDSRCLTGRALCISKRTNSLVWVVDGTPHMRVDVRFGSQELPTREGAFSVGWKSRTHVSTLYKTPMPFAMFFSGGQAVHYSPDFAARGYNGASHGCVNVRDRQAIESLFGTVQVGDKVIVYR